MSLLGGSRSKLAKFTVPAMERRITELEQEVQEVRRLNRRLAELMDIVEELLVPISLRDEEKVRQYLDRHSSTL